MRHSLRIGERVWIVAVDAETGRSLVHPCAVEILLQHGLKFDVGNGCWFYTPDEGMTWCRDDPEDIAALSAAVAMAE